MSTYKAWLWLWARLPGTAYYRLSHVALISLAFINLKWNWFDTNEISPMEPNVLMSIYGIDVQMSTLVIYRTQFRLVPFIFLNKDISFHFLKFESFVWWNIASLRESGRRPVEF